MTEILIKDISLKNFKGIKSLKANLNDGYNEIRGANGTGKTTLVDAFNWLLFEKDSTGAANFDIKTISPDGSVKSKLDHEVIANLEINGQQVELKKTYSEDWKTKRGTSAEIFSGHTTDRYINGVPTKQKDYNAYIANLVDEEKFKLLTNPLYLAGMDWKKRRQLLWQLVDDVSPDEIIAANPEAELIKDELKTETAEQLKDKYSYQRKNIEKEKADIPVRIDTLHDTIVELEADALNLHIRVIRGAIDKVDEDLQGEAANTLTEAQERATKLALEIAEADGKQDIERSTEKTEIRTRLVEAEYRLDDLRQELTKRENSKNELIKEVSSLNHNREIILRQYKEKIAEQVKIDLDAVCPTCNRPFNEHELEGRTTEITEKANKAKAAELEEINRKGLAIKAAREELEKQIEKATSTIEETKKLQAAAQENFMKVTQEFAAHKDKQWPDPAAEKREELERLHKEINAAKNNNLQYNKGELLAKKAELQQELERENKKLWQLEQNTKTLAQIKELDQTERELSIQLMSVLAKLNAIEEYTRTKAELLEAKLNEKFTTVKVRLFIQQINGGIQEACDLLIDGYKPWSTASTGERIAAGVELTQALSSYYNITAPLWIDNHESVTKELKIKGQAVGLYADAAVKKLKIN